MLPALGAVGAPGLSIHGGIEASMQAARARGMGGGGWGVIVRRFVRILVPLVSLLVIGSLRNEVQIAVGVRRGEQLLVVRRIAGQSQVGGETQAVVGDIKHLGVRFDDHRPERGVGIEPVAAGAPATATGAAGVTGSGWGAVIALKVVRGTAAAGGRGGRMMRRRARSTCV